MNLVPSTIIIMEWVYYGSVILAITDNWIVVELELNTLSQVLILIELDVP